MDTIIEVFLTPEGVGRDGTDDTVKRFVNPGRYNFDRHIDCDLDEAWIWIDETHHMKWRRNEIDRVVITIRPKTRI